MLTCGYRRIVSIRAIVEFGEPWDADPSEVEVELAEGGADSLWPKLVTLRNVGRRTELLGRTVKLDLRHEFDDPPTVGNEPTVYVVVVDAAGTPQELLGYGPVYLVGQPRVGDDNYDP